MIDYWYIYTQVLSLASVGFNPTRTCNNLIPVLDSNLDCCCTKQTPTQIINTNYNPTLPVTLTLHPKHLISLTRTPTLKQLLF